MYRRILLNTKLSAKERIKKLFIYYKIRRGARILWKIRFRNVFKQHPFYNTPAEKSVEKQHNLYWRPFHKHINYSTLRVCNSISCISNPKYIPEEIFVADIEPTLNHTPAVEYLNYKSLYNRWFPGNIFPCDYFHNIDGEWLDQHLKSVTFNEIRSLASELRYPVVLKPNRDSYGGKNIFFPKDSNELLELCENLENFLVQEKITQHSFFEQFNKHGINTLRVNIYRSVSDNNYHIVNMVLRMGVGGSLDNETAGGIVAMVRKDGFLNGFAVDKYGEKFLNHPDTGIAFDQKIPDFGGLKRTALEIAHKIFYARLICLDLCYDAEKVWRMIEVNINRSTIRFAQYHGALFFDGWTDEVHDYCLKNHWSLK